jgi:hypothetical protein
MGAVMSFEENEDSFVWYCEGKGCRVSAVFPPKNFYDCVAEIKSRGWLIERDSDGQWCHWCGKCKWKRSEGVMDKPFSSIRRA